MAFDNTNYLEVDATVESDFQFTDRSGTVDSLLQARNTSGDWCLETTGSTTSGSTGPTANPSGRSAYIYTEASSPAASSVWAMKRKISFDSTSQDVYLDIIYNLYIDTGSEFYVEYATVASPNETTDWSILETISGTNTNSWISDTFDFSAYQSTTLWIRIRFNSLNAYTNDLAFSTWREYSVDLNPSITDVETDEDISHGETGITITGSGFLATKGTGKVELSDNIVYATGTKVTQTTTSWGATAIDFTVNMSTLGVGTRYVWVTNDDDAINDAFAVALHRAQAFEISASGNITASGENTTRQLTYPSGKGSGDFDGGRIQDDENPTDTVDVTDGGFREDEWCMQATVDAEDAAQYEFRVLIGGEVQDTITVTPKWTITGGDITAINTISKADIAKWNNVTSVNIDTLNGITL
jgi:hypothetical protein